MNMQTSGTALALPEPASLATMLKTEGGLDSLLKRIEADALVMVKDLDPTVAKDRDLMKSAAHKVSLSKAELDRQGKALTETQRREVASVNAGRKVAETFLADIRDRVRAPADVWDAKEADRAIAVAVGRGLTIVEIVVEPKAVRLICGSLAKSGNDGNDAEPKDWPTD